MTNDSILKFITENSEKFGEATVGTMFFGDGIVEFRKVNDATFLLTKHPLFGWGAWFAETDEDVNNPTKTLDRFKQIANLK